MMCEAGYGRCRGFRCGRSGRWSSMKGDGEDNGLRNILSLGSSSRSTGSRSEERERFSERVGTSSGDESLELNLTLLSSLSRDGLTMLAGGSNGGFSLKPPPVGSLSGMPNLRNMVLGGGGEGASSKVTGGGFTGFYRSSAPKTSWSSTPAGMGLRLVSEETEVRDEAGTSSSHRESSGIAGKLEQPLTTDMENLTLDECWSLVLKLGKRWPAWDGTTALQSLQGVMKDRSLLLEGLNFGHHSHKEERLGGNPEILQLGQDSLQLLTSRALEALAQALDRYGRPAGSMLPPKLTTQEFSNNKGARDLPILTSQSAPPTLAVSRQPTLSTKLPTSSQVMAAPNSAGPKTAQLTIFYDGKVNVCNNIPEDKAHLLMLFAERSSINPKVQSPVPSASCAAPSTSTSPQVTPALGRTPQDSARPQEDLQLSQPSSHPVLVTGTSSVPSHSVASLRNHPGGSISHQKPIESSNPAEVATSGPPLKITVTEGDSRQLMQQRLNGPTSKRLPNARKNSLARFLDSRKRNRPTGESSEDQQPAKNLELGPPADGCPSDAENTKGSGKSPMPLCSQVHSKDGHDY